MDFDMELLLEGFALGFDAIILGFLYKSYESCNSYIEALKGAEQFEIGKIHDLATPKKPQHSFWKFWRWYGDSYATQSHALTDHRYVVLRGKVEPIDKNKLLHSLDNKTSGVIHRVTTKEVVAVCNGSRFWIDQERIVKRNQHEVPWALIPQEAGSKKTMVQIIDGLGADSVDLPVIRDEFIPAPFSLSTWLGGWVAGQQVKGTQEIEEMLIDGTLLTAVGELVVGKDGSIHLRSPLNSNRDLPFILSTLPYNALLNTYETFVTVCKWSIVFFGGVGVVLCYLMVRKWLRIRSGRRHEREEDEILRDLQESRVAREENDDLPDWQRCVVCLVRTREVIVLPCGHVCLCADCMLLINQQQFFQRNCPMCRQRIDQIARAFVP